MVGSDREGIMDKEAVLIWDCGATNIRAVVVSADGRLIAEAKAANDVVPQEGDLSLLVWDVDRIFDTLCSLTCKVTSQVGKDSIKAITITTWGADATCVDEDGRMLYPLISWRCKRTEGIAERIRNIVDPEEIFVRTGYQIIPFNTIIKLLWIKENAPDVWEKTFKVLTITGLLIHRLTGRFVNDPTMAGTSMAFNLIERDWDDKILSSLGMDRSIFPETIEPGKIIENIRDDIAEKLGLNKGIPVICAGHDTQFAIYGSGFREGEAVLSSGTWEILMIRVKAFRPTEELFRTGVIIEQDAIRGYLNPQFLMQGSGPLEWIVRNFWQQDAEEKKKDLYDAIIEDAKNVPAGSDGLVFIPSFVPETGPASRYRTPGSIIGLRLETKREQIYRAALEGLSMQLRAAVDIFSDNIGFRPKAIRIVGGGSKNMLWNKIRADVLGIPVIITEHKEATVLGAAIFAFVGLNIYKDIEDAIASIDLKETKILPNSNLKGDYDRLYDRYLRLTKDLGISFNS